MTQHSDKDFVNQDIVTITLENEMKNSYLDYAMSVIVSRALPDVRDGLKPVHRRILYAMNEIGLDYNRPHRKSANVVGTVMADYHPHGDAAIYDTLVRLAQPFSMRLPLIDGQGNFGSMDGDPAAASRYTESRLAKAAQPLLDDIDRNTVDFRPNYDERTQEPMVLPAKYPNLLINGASGIAVGMATNIPPHNLGEVMDACCAYVKNPHIQLCEIMQHIQGPDFPTGGIIVGRGAIYQAFSTGRGSIVMRGRTHVEEVRKEREAIIVTEIPYQVNKSKLIERIAELVKIKQINGISDLRDESDRHGVRIVIELKREAIPEVVLNQLYSSTSLQSSFSVNSLALDNGQPKLMPILKIISAFVTFREEVIVRRIKFELRKSQSRAHILIGLAVAVTNIDEFITLIRAASDPQNARDQILNRDWDAQAIELLVNLVNEPGHRIVNGKYRLSEEQAKAILDLRLHRLTGLERDKISAELKDLVTQIEDYISILGSKQKIADIIYQEFVDIKEQFATPRLTTIEDGNAHVDFEDLIQSEEMVITVSQKGYIKRVPLDTYRAQRRGGRGRSGMATRGEDVVNDVFVANTHTPLLFFSSRGIAYVLKVYTLPLASRQSFGKAMINLLPLETGETISTVMPLLGDTTSWETSSIVFITSHGTIRRNKLSDFTNVRSKGKIAMKLESGESLVAVRMCTLDHDVLLATRNGKCIRFAIRDIREFSSRKSTGVRAIRLSADDEVIAVSILNHVEFSIEERNAYIKLSRQRRNIQLVDEAPESDLTNDDDIDSIDDTSSSSEIELTEQRYQELAAQEQMILTVSSLGYGKQTSAYEYRIFNRGGQGLVNIFLTSKTGFVAGNFVAEATDDVVLVTNDGQLIRFPVNQVRIAGRMTKGVILFRINKDEQVVSVARVPRDETEDDNITDNSIESDPEQFDTLDHLATSPENLDTSTDPMLHQDVAPENQELK